MLADPSKCKLLMSEQALPQPLTELQDLYLHVTIGNQWVDATIDPDKFVKFYNLSNLDAEELGIANPASLKFTIVVNRVENNICI